jgi:hypothetical protein
LNFNFNLKTQSYESTDETPVELLIFTPQTQENSQEDVSLDCLDRNFFFEETQTVLQNTEQILKNLYSERSKLQSNFKYLDVSKNLIEKRWRMASEIKNELIRLKQEFQYGTRSFDPYATLKRLHELQNIVLSSPLPSEITNDEFVEEEDYDEEYDEEYGQYESKYFY